MVEILLVDECECILLFCYWRLFFCLGELGHDASWTFIDVQLTRKHMELSLIDFNELYIYSRANKTWLSYVFFVYLDSSIE